jgi:uncharacterized protein YjbJ (UPF0337 family)
MLLSPSSKGLPCSYHLDLTLSNPDQETVHPKEPMWAMDKEHVKGAVDNAVGKTKEVIGQMFGDKQLEVEGQLDQASGAAHSAVGNAKDAARETADRLHRSTNRF